LELLGALVALVLAAVVGRLAIGIGNRFGVVDAPDGELKPHDGAPVPLGGAAVLVAAIGGLAVAGVLEVGLIVAAVLVWVVGLIDDTRGLSPAVRLVGVTIAGVVLVVLSERSFGTNEMIFWVVAVVVVANAVNLFDGLDALAGSVATVAVLGMIGFGMIQGLQSPWVVAVVGGAILGFLYWNRPPARLYLGDNGAYVVGLLLVWAAMFTGVDRMSRVVAVGLVGVPLIELGVTVFRRGLSGTPLFSGDRDHTYDRFYAHGVSEAKIALSYAAVQAVWAIVIIAVSMLTGDLPTAITALALGAGLAALVGVLMTVSQS
jgi:UDP-GlcNAc:undecaprenyl-phosphate/decaprenyl-phosphate GlcNAc-1-phosphate transferase